MVDEDEKEGLPIILRLFKSARVEKRGTEATCDLQRLRSLSSRHHSNGAMKKEKEKDERKSAVPELGAIIERGSAGRKKSVVLTMLDKFHGINGKNVKATLTWPFQKKEVTTRLLARELVQEKTHDTASFKPYSDVHDENTRLERTNIMS